MADRCSSCQAEIVWATSAKSGGPMPLNAVNVPSGNVVLREGKAVVLGKVALAELPAETPRFVSHHATCPQGPAWRGQARGRK